MLQKLYLKKIFFLESFEELFLILRSKFVMEREHVKLKLIHGTNTSLSHVNTLARENPII